MSDYFAETMTRITETKIKSRKQRENTGKQTRAFISLSAMQISVVPLGTTTNVSD